MNNNETAKFIYQDINIDVIISVEDNTVWLSKEQIALLFKRDRSVISKRIKMIEVEKLYDFSRVCAKIAHTAKDGKEYDVAFYNLEIVIEIGRRTKSEITTTFYAWCIEKLSELNHKNMMESNIIRFNNDNLSIDVQISPEEQTVWLSQNQIAILFDSTQQNISLHIKNIINENELDFDSVHKEYLYTATDGKVYSVSFYNLDMILAIGYRVKTNRAIIFRKWASDVLKQYLLKGYVINDKRALVTNENYINLIYEVNKLRNDVKDIKNAIEKKVIDTFICYEGEYYDGFSFINQLICSAKERIVIVDGYADDTIFNFFLNSNKAAKKTIICHKKERINIDLIETFTKQYGKIEIKEDKSFHDRFLVTDNDIYLLGCSLNSIGHKTTCIIKIKGLEIKSIIGNK